MEYKRSLKIGVDNYTENDIVLDIYGNVNVTGVVTASSFSGNASSATYATSSGVSTYSSTAGIATYATSAGIATYSSTAGIATNVIGGIASVTTLNVSGVSTLGNTVVGGATTQLIVNGDARITGILTIGTSSITLDGSNNVVNVGSGITINGSTGTINASSINLGGTVLTGVGVTYITAGSGISVDQNTGNVTITATGGGGGSSQWVTTGAGIHTLSNVGIGTTNPTSKLTVQSGDVKVGIDTSQGIILTDANGVAWRLFVNTNGNLGTIAV